MIKGLLIDHIRNNTTDNEIAILLSGGIDSISCAIAAHDIGKVVASIKKGDHVHIHNVKTKKW